MNRVLFRQPGLFAQLRRRDEGLVAARDHGAIIREHIALKGATSVSQNHCRRENNIFLFFCLS